MKATRHPLPDDTLPGDILPEDDVLQAVASILRLAYADAAGPDLWSLWQGRFNGWADFPMRIRKGAKVARPAAKALVAYRDLMQRNQYVSPRADPENARALERGLLIAELDFYNSWEKTETCVLAHMTEKTVEAIAWIHAQIPPARPGVLAAPDNARRSAVASATSARRRRGASPLSADTGQHVASLHDSGRHDTARHDTARHDTHSHETCRRDARRQAAGPHDTGPNTVQEAMRGYAVHRASAQEGVVAAAAPAWPGPVETLTTPWSGLVRAINSRRRSLGLDRVPTEIIQLAVIGLGHVLGKVGGDLVTSVPPTLPLFRETPRSEADAGSRTMPAGRMAGAVEMDAPTLPVSSLSADGRGYRFDLGDNLRERLRASLDLHANAPVEMIVLMRRAAVMRPAGFGRLGPADLDVSDLGNGIRVGPLGFRRDAALQVAGDRIRMAREAGDSAGRVRAQHDLGRLLEYRTGAIGSAVLGRCHGGSNLMVGATCGLSGLLSSPGYMFGTARIALNHRLGEILASAAAAPNATGLHAPHRDVPNEAPIDTPTDIRRGPDGAPGAVALASSGGDPTCGRGPARGAIPDPSTGEGPTQDGGPAGRAEPGSRREPAHDQDTTCGRSPIPRNALAGDAFQTPAAVPVCGDVPDPGADRDNGSEPESVAIPSEGAIAPERAIPADGAVPAHGAVQKPCGASACGTASAGITISACIDERAASAEPSCGGEPARGGATHSGEDLALEDSCAARTFPATRSRRDPVESAIGRRGGQIGNATLVLWRLFRHAGLPVESYITGYGSTRIGGFVMDDVLFLNVNETLDLQMVRLILGNFRGIVLAGETGAGHARKASAASTEPGHAIMSHDAPAHGTGDHAVRDTAVRDTAAQIPAVHDTTVHDTAVHDTAVGCAPDCRTRPAPGLATGEHESARQDNTGVPDGSSGTGACAETHRTGQAAGREPGKTGPTRQGDEALSGRGLHRTVGAIACPSGSAPGLALVHTPPAMTWTAADATDRAAVIAGTEGASPPGIFPPGQPQTEISLFFFGFESRDAVDHWLRRHSDVSVSAEWRRRCPEKFEPAKEDQRIADACVKLREAPTAKTRTGSSVH